MRIFLIAGEASGDLLGGRLMAALKRRLPDVEFHGVGGPAMQAEGLVSLFPMQELSLMGMAELLPHVPKLLRRLDQTEQAVRDIRPAALVTIDAPAFCLRITRRVKGLGIPRIHYVAIQVWAWRPWRAKRVARSVDRLMTLLPFEPTWFERHGLPTRFVGHPVVEGGASKGDGARFRSRHGLSPDTPLLVVLPGSRRGEIARLTEIFGATVGLLANRLPGLRVAVPTVAHMVPAVRAAISDWAGEPILVEGEADKFDAFAAGDAALAASGTVALELTLAGTPMVVAYRVAPMTAAIVRRLIKVPFVSLTNIVAGRAVVPELLQNDCTPPKLADTLEGLIRRTPERATQIQGLAEVSAALRTDRAPSDLAADYIIETIRASAPKATTPPA